WRGPKEALPCPPDAPTCSYKVVGETFGAAADLSASRIGPDRVSVPSAAEHLPSGASAPVRLGTAEEDQLGVALVVSGASSTGTSYGTLDYLDMNGDGYPDVVGSGRVSFTDQVGGRGTPESVDGLGDDVRKDHQFALGYGGGGSPVSVKKSSSGDGNTPKQAGGGPKIGGHRKPTATKKGGAKANVTAKVQSLRAAPSGGRQPGQGHGGQGGQERRRQGGHRGQGGRPGGGGQGRGGQGGGQGRCRQGGRKGCRRQDQAGEGLGQEGKRVQEGQRQQQPVHHGPQGHQQGGAELRRRRQPERHVG
ncbi:MAG TPA: hypothetical protein VM263_08720, partial [Acidimicrobiales bacterium]|nr:hypothetical protein [Acidimicrobiales bacterium]